MKIIVIGAGAAGLMAAGRAAELGAKVLVLEKMKQSGRKLCITGKGRCNITNTAELPDFIVHFGKTGNFLRQAYGQFFNTDLMDFLEKSGLTLVTERGGRVFPASGKARDVLDTLMRWLTTHQVHIQYSSPVEKILTANGQVTGVVSQGKKHLCNTVILATGGASYPATGSSGDGYRLSESCGHSIIPIRPALVPLETCGTSTGKMDGLNLRNIKVSLFVNGKKKNEAFGEVTFAKFGLTGPAILTLSGEIVDLLHRKQQIQLSLDLKPALNDKKLDARLVRDFTSRAKETLSSVLRGLLPKEMVPICLEEVQLSADRQVTNITAAERKKIRFWLKNFIFTVTNHRPFSEAIITAGGINTREINPKTMESRLTKGLFIVGELLDLHADTGGYNLQAAFSTGWVAGQVATGRNIS